MAKKSKSKTSIKPKPAKAKAPARIPSATITLEQILQQLEALGDASVRKQNAKWGASENQFGVKRGDLRKLADKIKTNHELALSLWKTNNIDAQFLATLIIDGNQLSAAELDHLVKTITFAWVADWLHSYVVKERADKETLRQKWLESKDRWQSRAGWQLTAGRVAKSPAGLDLVALLDRIEKEMPTAPAEVQWTMNACLAEIGIHHAQHRQRAIAIGEQLGVYRDYPCSKGCTSPFAPLWINEMVRRQG